MVVGGQAPIEYAHKTPRLVEEEKEGSLRVNVLDLGASYPLKGRRGMATGRWRWLNPPSENSPQWLETAAVILDIDRS